MDKITFLEELRLKLNGFPDDEIEERLGFYSEAVDDRMEEGLSEEEAVNELGNTDEIVSQIISEIPLSKIVREKAKKRKAPKVWTIILLILGFPIWGSILIALIAVALSLYIVLWSLVIVVYAVNITFAAGALVSLVCAGIYMVSGKIAWGFCFIGAALIFAGLAILCFYLSVLCTKGTIKLTKKIIIGIKSLFIGKGVSR